MNIYYHDGLKESAKIENISNYATMLTEEGVKRASEISEAVVYYPTVICQNNVDIIDTPGLNVIGMAGASEDSYNLYQVGINIMDEYREKALEQTLLHY